MKKHETLPDTHQDIYSKTVFGFWLYLLTDLMLFATIFAAFAVLKGNHFEGPSAKELFNLEFATLQTLLFLVSTLAISIGGVFAHRKNRKGVITFYLISFVLGLLFLILELQELSHFCAVGSGWKENAFASVFFSLIGMFLLHLIFALIWTATLLIDPIREGIQGSSLRRLTCLKMFWQFLNLIWIFVYTMVYLLGVVS